MAIVEYLRVSTDAQDTAKCAVVQHFAPGWIATWKKLKYRQ